MYYETTQRLQSFDFDVLAASASPPPPQATAASVTNPLARRVQNAGRQLELAGAPLRGR
jgi:hypothetical protein